MFLSSLHPFGGACCRTAFQKAACERIAVPPADARRLPSLRCAQAAAKQFEQKPYQIVVLQTLREYLQLELHVPDLPFEDDKERLIDDFVFMCFFCGNDFLPHMPTLEIREGAIELLMTTYKRVLPELGGYLCEGGDASLERVAKFMGIIGQYEEQIFSKRSRIAARQRERRRHGAVDVAYDGSSEHNAGADALADLTADCESERRGLRGQRVSEAASSLGKLRGSSGLDAARRAVREDLRGNLGRDVGAGVRLLRARAADLLRCCGARRRPAWSFETSVRGGRWPAAGAD